MRGFAFFKGQEGKKRCIMGDVQMANDIVPSGKK